MEDTMDIENQGSANASSSSSSSSSSSKGKGSAGGARVVWNEDKTQDTLPWVEKYRPESLSDVIAHEEIVSTIDKLTAAGRLPHLLLYGPPGTGKTSTVLAIAKKLYGEREYASMTLELNASDERGIDVVRDKIKVFAGTRKLFSSGQVKLVILDEADSMTKDAQFALRRVIERYTKTCRFCMICNYVSKIIPALQSRCTKFRFQPLSESQIVPRVEQVLVSEGLTLEPNDALALAAGGSSSGGSSSKCRCFHF